MTRLRVLSYNVHGLRDDTGALAAVVRGLEPDVVVVQEAPRRLRWRSRCAGLARSFGLVYGAGGLPGLGNLVLTGLRVRVTETWHLRFPLTPGRHLRGAVFARCAVGADSFVVVGSHLATDPAERPGQAARLGRALGEVPGPLIVGADLNEEPGGVSWRRVAGELADAALATGPAGGAPAGGGRGTFPAASPRARLDAIFVGGPVTVDRYEVVDTPETRRASDHLPVLAEVTFAAA